MTMKVLADEDESTESTPMMEALAEEEENTTRPRE